MSDKEVVNMTYSSVKDSSHESKIDFEIVPTEVDSRSLYTFRE